MDDHYEELCDDIDSGILSGDSFNNKEACDRLEEYMARWQRQIADIRRENYFQDA